LRADVAASDLLVLVAVSDAVVAFSHSVVDPPTGTVLCL